MTTTKSSVVQAVDHENKPSEKKQPDAATTMAFADNAIVPRIKVVRVEKNKTSYRTEADLLSAELFRRNIGANDPNFPDVVISELTSACSRNGDVDETRLNAMLSVVTGMRPKDQIETLLLVQMSAVHVAAMKCACFLANATTLPEFDSYQNALNKLVRTSVAQMDIFNRYRTNGEQKVTVQQNVSVRGQAIVGNVTQAAREETQVKAANSAFTKARAEPMPIIEDSAPRVRVPLNKGDQN